MVLRFRWSSTGFDFRTITVLVIINDLPGVSIFDHFAEDGKTLSFDLQILQDDVQSYLNWAARNSMLFYASKTQFLSVEKLRKI